MGNFTDRMDGPASQSGPRRVASQGLKMTPLSDRCQGVAALYRVRQLVVFRGVLFLCPRYFFILILIFIFILRLYQFSFVLFKFFFSSLPDIVKAPRLTVLSILYTVPHVIPIHTNPRRDGRTRMHFVFRTKPLWGLVS
jgi:hypothetical protein